MILQNIFIIIFQIFSFAYANKRQIHIGGIFHEVDSILENAFHAALLRENIDNAKFIFTPIVRLVDPDDSFGAEKIACELASLGVVGIFGPHSVQTSKIVGSICNNLGIPHIIAHWTPGEVRGAAEQHSYTRNFFPDNDLYARALAKIMDDYDWKGFTLLYENNESLEKLQDVLEGHGPSDNPVTIRQLPEDDDYQSLLKFISTSQESHIVIDCSPEKVMKIFKQAFDVKMMGEYQSYIVTSLDSHLLDFAELTFFRANITTIRLMDPSSDEVKNAVYDWRRIKKGHKGFTEIYVDQIKTETALFYDAVATFLTSFRETFATRTALPVQLQCNSADSWLQGIQLIEQLNKTTARGMTGRIVFDNDGNRADFYMEVLELNKEGFNKIAVVDPITMTVSYMRTSEQVQSQVYQSFQNKTFIVASILGPPFLMLRKTEEGQYLEGNDRYEGYSVDLIDSIAKTLGFSYKFDVLMGDNAKQGSIDPKTKKWTGLVKQLLERVGISIIYAKPHKDPPALFSFMSPLSLKVWLCMAIAYLCISILLFFLARTAADDWENPHPCNADPEELETIWNMHNCIWLTAGSIMQQGCDILPKAISTRLTAGLWWFFALIVISSYTANLAAFLTMERMESTIESAEDLAKQSDIKYGGVKDGSTLAFFKSSNFSTYQRMWAAMESAGASVFVGSNLEGVERVKKSNRKYAFLMENTLIEYYSARNCTLTQIGGLLDSKGYGIALPMNSPYRTHISQTVLKMQEEGKLHKFKKRWWEQDKDNSSGCEAGDKGSSATPELGMDNVGGVFLVLVGGLGISILIGILEFLWNISKVSVAEKITQWEAFKSELMFALDIRITTKPIQKSSSEKSRSVSNRSSKSVEVDHTIVPGWKFNMDEKQAKV